MPMPKPLLTLLPAAILLAGCLAGCLDGSDDSGDVNAPAVYVAMGDALTAGFQNNGLRADWQKASYPAVIAGQMGVEDFELPLVDTPGIGREKLPQGGTTPLYQDGANIAFRPLGVPVASLLLNAYLPRPYDNLGVPGAATKDVMTAYDSTTSTLPGNGFFNLILRGSLLNNTSMIDQAISRRPGIITLWIGNSDLLGGVVAGTIVPGVTVVPAAAYQALMDGIVDSLLAATDAQIFLANIPAITSIPFVTTVPRFRFNPITLQADTTKPLATKESDVQYVLLPALAEILGKGTGIPKADSSVDSLPGTFTLTRAEVTAVEGLIDAYNAYLAQKASDNARVTLVDVNGLLKRLAAGEIPGLSARFPAYDPTQSAFGLDGIHPNTKGHKEVANLFLEAINAKLSTKHPLAE